MIEIAAIIGTSDFEVVYRESSKVDRHIVLGTSFYCILKPYVCDHIWNEWKWKTMYHPYLPAGFVGNFNLIGLAFTY